MSDEFDDEDDFVFSGSSKPADDPAPKAALECEVCGTSLTYAGRGRKPRFCVEHKTSAPASTGKRKTASLEVIRSGLHESFAGVGAMLCMVNMTDGMIVINKSDDLANVLVQMAERDPKVKKALEASLRGTSYFALFAVLASIAGPIMFNHGLIGAVVDDNGNRVPNPSLIPVMAKMGGFVPPEPAHDGT